MLAVCASALAQAAGIEPKTAAVLPTEDGWALTADFAVELGPRLEDAVARGVPLFFKLEVVLERPRQYWIAEHIVTRVVETRLAYNSLTRQYRVSAGGLQQNFATLEEALRRIGRAAALPLLERGALKAGESYQAALRLSLDHSQLPKPFQVDALTDKEWQIEAKTRRWQFVAPEAR